MKIKIEYLSDVKEIDVDPSDTIETLKNIIGTIYDISVEEQSLILNERNLNSSSKQLEEVGINSDSLIHVKRIHRVGGKMKNRGLGSMMKNPMVKNILKNPSAMKSIQEMFPGLKDEMEENSYLKAWLNSQGMEEELEMINKDDEYMNTYMRNADITMAKLQNLPDGMRLMSSIAKDSMGLSNIQLPKADLKGGDYVTERIEKPIPGKNRKNFLVEYRKQLCHLKQIGFDDVRENIEVLKKFNGDLEQALEVLTSKYAS